MVPKVFDKLLILAKKVEIYKKLPEKGIFEENMIFHFIKKNQNLLKQLLKNHWF